MKRKLIFTSVVTAVLAVFAVALGPTLGVYAQSEWGGFARRDAYVPSAFKLWFGDVTSSDILLTKGAANTLALGPAGAHLGATAANKDVAGTATLSGGTVTVTFTNTFTSAPVCVATDQTAANAVKAAPTTTTVVFTGTTTDVIAYACIGNPN